MQSPIKKDGKKRIIEISSLENDDDDDDIDGEIDFRQSSPNSPFNQNNSHKLVYVFN